MKEGIQNGITLEILMTKKHKKTPEEKAAVAKQKKQQRRARRKQETRHWLNRYTMSISLSPPLRAVGRNIITTLRQ